MSNRKREEQGSALLSSRKQKHSTAVRPVSGEAAGPEAKVNAGKNQLVCMFLGNTYLKKPALGCPEGEGLLFPPSCRAAKVGRMALGAPRKPRRGAADTDQ